MPDKAHEFAGMKETPATSSTGLDALLRAAAESGEAGARPVDSWNPPYCGDIGMKIRRDGAWAYQGSPIGRIALVKLFASILRKDDDGKTYLVTPTEKVDVEVEDAPFLAVEMAVSGDGRDQTLTFRTNVDDVVTLNADHPLRFEQTEPDGGLKPYVLVRGRLEALCTRAVYAELVALAEPKGRNGDKVGVWSGGVWWELA
ncbi:hypothetical protein HYPDE_35458 [Hyphomicrobium denitrificans 1NES1]|uniref:Proteophosphoglycan n=1 Tax=Hyphomicrobium denitrificans 1NES1 TaxID=670307 RepID=N0B6W2_9HYPH|nr:DUF1285 domain-containing protein [Hyphomicrobium denitrificans]AGK58763.1 hypothetical protein HYPDE_35458 [Hyphomicrobium denitrificans 1NES1]